MTSTPPPCGLREQKKRESRTALRLAALELVAEYGLDAVRVEDIAQRAGVSPRTFFNYFPSKEQALVNQTPDTGRELAARLRRAAEEAPVHEALLGVLVDYGTEMARDRTAWRLVRQVTCRHPELIRVTMGANQETLRALTEETAALLGLDADQDPYPTVLVEASVAAIRSAASHHLRRLGEEAAAVLPDDEVPALRSALEQAGQVLRSGLLPPERR